VTLGVEAFNLGAKLKATVSKEFSSTINVAMPAGFDYEWRKLSPIGMLCVEPSRRAGLTRTPPEGSTTAEAG
jgi:hypothetical protein